MPNQYDLRVERTIKFKNARLFDELQRWPRISAFCSEFNLRPQRVNSILMLRERPYFRSGKLKPIAAALVDALGVPSLELFPPDLYANAGHFIPLSSVLLANSIEMVELKEAASVAAPELLESGAMANELKAALDGVLSTLEPRQKTIIELRFGLQDGVEHTLKEIATLQNVTAERIRQIETKAFYRLRASQRMTLLRPSLGGFL
jgi:RNA polymerase sigma factor (sigma-70 family)